MYAHTLPYSSWCVIKINILPRDQVVSSKAKSHNSIFIDIAIFSELLSDKTWQTKVN